MGDGAGVLRIVVNRSDIADFQRFIQQEDMRGAGRAVLREDLLPFIQQVGKIELLVFGALLHLGEAVAGREVGIVGLDGNDRIALRSHFFVQLDEPVFVHDRVGAGIAGEGHDEALGFLVVFEGNHFPVHILQAEVRGGITYFEAARRQISRHPQGSAGQKEEKRFEHACHLFKYLFINFL